jgi:hypothetical protein
MRPREDDVDEIADIAFQDRWRPTNFTATKDPAESARVGKAIRATPTQCWFNSRRAIMRLDEYAGAAYVEGWAVLDDVLPIDHGWVVRGDAVIDPTLPEQAVAYFPGLEFPGRVGIAEFLKTPEGRRCRRSPFYYAFGGAGRSARASWPPGSPP